MKTSIKPKINVICIGMLFFIAMTTFLGCLANYGRNMLSDEVNNVFESFQVLPDHTYYYSGSDASPDAIIGIHKRYELDSADVWTKVDLANKQLKYWVETMAMASLKGYPAFPDGYYILDPDEKPIGVYYTPWDPGPVRMEGENRVTVYLPSVKDERGDDKPKEFSE